MIMIILVMTAMFCSCSGKQKQKDSDAIQIAVVCEEGMENLAGAYKKGIEMALDEYDGSYEIAVEIYGEDISEYEKGVALDLELAQDPDVTAVISLQHADIINAAALHMEENDKAFFAVKDYDMETAEQRTETFFPFGLNAEHLGAAMGLYARENTKGPVAVFHDGLDHNIRQANAFDQMSLYGGGDYELISSLSQPFTTNELSKEIGRWESLGVRTVYAPYSDFPEIGMIYLSAIKQRMPEVSILACIAPKSDEMESLLASLEGMVMPSFYPVDFDETYEAWTKRYEEKFGGEPSNEAVQAYDIATLVIENYDGDNRTLAQNIKANSEDTSGVAGDIVNDVLNGLPEVTYNAEDVYDYGYMVVKDGKLTDLQ